MPPDQSFRAAFLPPYSQLHLRTSPEAPRLLPADWVTWIMMNQHRSKTKGLLFNSSAHMCCMTLSEAQFPSPQDEPFGGISGPRCSVWLALTGGAVWTLEYKLTLTERMLYLVFSELQAEELT